MEQVIQLLSAHGTPTAIAAWVGVVLFIVLTMHATIRMLRSALALRNDWKQRPR